MSKKISMIVPIYNTEKYLRKCLDSLVGQTYSNIEIICVNDGSKDQSLSLLQEYKARDDRIKIINQSNQGVSQSRNNALKEATGEYLIYVDSDDWIDRDTCEVSLKEAERADADLVFWPYIREFPGGSKPKALFTESKKEFSEIEVKKQLQRRICGLSGEELANPEDADSLVTAWGKLYRTEIIKENHIEFIDMKEIGTEDALFNLYAFSFVKKAVYINRYFNHYRKDNGNSLTSIYKKDLSSQWNALFDKMEAFINEREQGEDFYKALDNRVCLSILGLGLNICESNLSTREKVRELNRILCQPRYRKAYKELTLRYFPVHWKCFYGSAKYRFAFGVYVLLLCIKKIIGR